MAFFGVTIEKIGKIWNHPNADKLELASCEGLGFQFVVPKGIYSLGQEVLYFPIDSILPDEYKEKFGIRAPGRIKTVQMRGQYSQGFVYSLEKSIEFFKTDFKKMSPSEITLFFKVTKYEPPQKFQTIGTLVDLPIGQGIYDIENIARYLHVWSSLLEQECVITEKLEGTNISISKYDGQTFVCQRANAIIEKPDVPNAYWEAARQTGLLEKIKNLNYSSIAVFGELCGPSIQNNIYKLEKHTIFIFDVKIDGKWLNVDQLKAFCDEHDILTVPVIARGLLKTILGEKSIDEYADGFSVLFNTLREGVVIKPVIEQFDPELRRVILKKQSLKYLAQD